MNTFWTTETYNSFSKSGVGIVLDAGRPVDLDRIEVVTDSPGFTALIRAGDRPDGGFVDVSEEQTANNRTVFRLEEARSIATTSSGSRIRTAPRT